MIGTIISVVIKNVVQLFKPKNEREYGLNMNAGKKGLDKFNSNSILRISDEYNALIKSIELKHNGTLKPKFSNTENGLNSIYEKLDTEDIYKLNQYHNKIIGDIDGQPVYGKKYELINSKIEVKEPVFNMVSSVANNSILSSVSKNRNNILSANSGVLTLESPKEPKQPQKTLITAILLFMSAIIFYNILKQ